MKNHFWCIDVPIDNCSRVYIYFEMSMYFLVLIMLVLQVQILEKRLNDQFVMRRALEKALGYKPCAIHSSNESCIPKVNVLWSSAFITGKRKWFYHITVMIYFWIVICTLFQRMFFQLMTPNYFHDISANWGANKRDFSTRARGHMLGATSPYALPKGLWTTTLHSKFCLWHGK
jgi:hypothetical protein